MTSTRARYWALVLPLAALVFMFCLSAATSVAAAEPGCGGSDSSERVCAQSGTTTPILAVVLDPLPVQTLDLPGVSMSPDLAPADPAQHHADLAGPRAPPSLTSLL